MFSADLDKKQIFANKHKKSDDIMEKNSTLQILGLNGTKMHIFRLLKVILNLYIVIKKSVFHTSNSDNCAVIKDSEFKATVINNFVC